jgi:hypothetical protein
LFENENSGSSSSGSLSTQIPYNSSNTFRPIAINDRTFDILDTNDETKNTSSQLELSHIHLTNRDEKKAKQAGQKNTSLRKCNEKSRDLSLKDTVSSTRKKSLPTANESNRTKSNSLNHNQARKKMLPNGKYGSSGLAKSIPIPTTTSTANAAACSPTLTAAAVGHHLSNVQSKINKFNSTTSDSNNGGTRAVEIKIVDDDLMTSSSSLTHISVEGKLLFL